MFRRAAFRWAQSTKLLVESSTALGPNTKVAHAALEDIEYAKDLLGAMFMPKASKIPAAYADRPTELTVAEVQDSVGGLAARIVTMRPNEVRKTPFNARVEPAPRPKVVDQPRTHRGVDLSAPVISKGGKMLWATIDCPACPSKATQRCQKDGGVFIEKPHTQRKGPIDDA
jgi:hypothetical protein